jgi:hypothetical protein
MTHCRAKPDAEQLEKRPHARSCRHRHMGQSLPTILVRTSTLRLIVTLANGVRRYF